jgi:hypothetical protein
MSEKRIESAAGSDGNSGSCFADPLAGRPCDLCNGWGIDPDEDFGPCRNGCASAPELPAIKQIINDVAHDLHSLPNASDQRHLPATEDV